ncbi:MAG TPA: hypothetical protein VGL68_00840, partial [Solirubrobacteraceae bacterium]
VAVSTNGASRERSDKVRVAIIGVGNCASAFVQGVHYYADADPTQAVPGLMHVDLGGYHVSDIEFTAAFDIDSNKVGKDLGEAIWSGENNTIKFADVAGGGQLAPLKGAVYVLAALSLITVAQRIAHVRRELSQPAV